MRRVRRALFAALIAFAGTACDPKASSTPPTACSEVIPGIDDYPADITGDFIDAPFTAWLATIAAPVDYDGRSGFWFDAHGVAVGWSQQEDSDICVVDHSGGDAPMA